ncbi:PspA-associated protein PspAA [Nocardioides zeicaulis]|uniref:PspA-associated domain-containing protein n=1 Tax=Nocardioides zeicaulis TaxID=1776857 RepID=A0ABV6DXB6_9ACTN
MIVRIMGEGQYDLDDHALDALNGLDNQIETAIEAGDEAMFRTALQGLLAAVRSSGTHHDPESLDESDLILPPPDATLDEVRGLLGDDGLIPG